MTTRQKYLRSILAQMKYKQGWTIRYVEPDKKEAAIWDGKVEITTTWTTDSHIRSERAASRREIPIYFGDDVPEIVNAVWEQILAMEIHEAQEWFDFRGSLIFYPHRLPKEIVD